MNTWQALRQIKATLEAATWADGTGGKVFGQVMVSAGYPRGARPAVRFPLARVWPTAATVDEAQAQLRSQAFAVEISQQVLGDVTGEGSLIGGARSGGQGESDGRGLLELEEILEQELGRVARLEGFNVSLVHSTGAEASQDEQFGYLAWRTYEFLGLLTRDRTYPPARRLAAADAGGQSVSLTWKVPAARFDRSALVLRRASGSTAPATVTDGDAVTVSGFAESLSDAVGVAGTYSYALFVGYDETGSGTPDRYSAADTATVVVA